MPISLLPYRRFRKLEDIQPEFLRCAGIKLLLLDLDNTIAPYGVYTPKESIVDWVADMKKAHIRLYIVSNSRTDRPKIFSRALGVPFVSQAGKPGTRGAREAMEKAGIPPSETAVCGDQIYTDTLCANLCGARALLVDPLSLKNPLLAMRWVLELPFRSGKYN